MILSCHDSVNHLRLHKESSQLANNLDYCITILLQYGGTPLRLRMRMRLLIRKRIEASPQPSSRTIHRAAGSNARA